MKVSAGSVIIAQFAVVVLSVLSLTTFSMFLGGATDFVLFLVSLPLLVVSGLVVVAWALWRPAWRKLLYALALLSVGASALALAPYASRLGRDLFFLSRRADLESFEREILAYGKIRRMSDGQRHFKELNGELVAYDPGRIDTLPASGLRATYPVGRVLTRDGIDSLRYDEFRTRLIRLKFIEFEVEPGYVAFLYDGILDNLQGFVHVRAGHAPPGLHGEFFDAELIALRPMGEGWFWFATT